MFKSENITNFIIYQIVCQKSNVFLLNKDEKQFDFFKLKRDLKSLNISWFKSGILMAGVKFTPW